MRRTSSLYSRAREPYKVAHPNARMHHMVPVSRDGADTEYNLFPWNEAAHTAWHRLFGALTVREVFHDVDAIHHTLHSFDGDRIVRTWCLTRYYHGRPSKKQDVLTPQPVIELLRCWRACFGSSDLRSARNVLRYMMLYMIFGRYADHFAAEILPEAVCASLIELRDDPERLWAFHECFETLPDGAFFGDIKERIQEIRRSVAHIPLH